MKKLIALLLLATLIMPALAHAQSDEVYPGLTEEDIASSTIAAVSRFYEWKGDYGATIYVAVFALRDQNVAKQFFAGVQRSNDADVSYDAVTFDVDSQLTYDQAMAYSTPPDQSGADVIVGHQIGVRVGAVILLAFSLGGRHSIEDTLYPIASYFVRLAATVKVNGPNDLFEMLPADWQLPYTFIDTEDHVLFPTSQPSANQSAEQPNVVSTRLFPRADDLGDGWLRQQSDILDVDRTIFRSERYMSFVGPHGAAMFVMIALPQPGADAEAWAAAGDMRDRAQAAFAPADDWTPAANPLDLPGIARGERALSINQWIQLPVGVGLYAMDSGHIMLIGVVGLIVTGPNDFTQGVAATDWIASFVAKQIDAAA